MANLIERIHLSGTADAKARDLALERIGESIRAFGGQNERFRKMNRYYHSLSPTRTRTSANDISIARTSKAKGHEDVFVPMCFALIASALPHWMFNLYGRKPHLKFLGRTSDDHEKADAVTKAIDYTMERAEIFLQSIPIGLSTYKYGTGIGKVGYRYSSHVHVEKSKMQKVVGFNPLTGKAIWKNTLVSEKEPIVDFDGPTLEPVSVYLAHPDPLYWRLVDMRFFGESRWTDRQTLEERDEQYRQLSGKRMYKNLDKIPPMARQRIGTTLQMDSQDDTAEAMGWNTSPLWGWSEGGKRWQNLEDAERHADQVVLVREYHERDRLIEVANDEIVIRDTENPNEDKQLPYVVTVCYPVEFSFWGTGYLHNSVSTQEQINSWRNLNLKQGRYNVHNVWGVPENVEIDVDEIEPNKIYQIPFSPDLKPLLIPLMQGRPIPPEGRYLEAALMMDAQRTHAAPDWMVGGLSSGAESATEARMQGEASASRLRLQGAIGEVSFLSQVGKKFLSRMKQYGRDEQVFRIMGDDGAVEFLQLTRQDIEGQFDIEPMTGVWYPNLDVLRQQMLEALSIVRGDPVMLEITDVYEIWKELWKLFPGIKSPERFLRPPTEKTWDPQRENIILDAGEWVEVTPSDRHDEHIPEHMKELAKAAAQNNERAVGVTAQHLQKHHAFAKQMQATPSQEMPGMKGAAGNVPSDINRAMPTEAQLLSRMAGGVGV